MLTTSSAESSGVCRSSPKYAELWQEVWFHIEDLGPQFSIRQMRAHTSWAAADLAGVPHHWFFGNAEADRRAKEGARLHPLAGVKRLVEHATAASEAGRRRREERKRFKIKIRVVRGERNFSEPCSGDGERGEAHQGGPPQEPTWRRPVAPTRGAQSGKAVFTEVGVIPLFLFVISY